MRVNDDVNYFDASGERRTATITKVAGTGKSLYKILDLTYRVDGEVQELEGVPHENDAEGGAFWLEKGQQRKPVEEATEEAPAPRRKKATEKSTRARR
jgi:hypothetical protein